MLDSLSAIALLAPMSFVETPTITVAIATHGDRCLNLQFPAQTDALCYVVLVQDAPTPLPATTRADITYITLDTRGLSHSRNSALDHCTTPFLLFADDDMTLNPTAIQSLATELHNAPALGFAAGWRAGRRPASGRKSGTYDLGKLNTGRICAPELLIRMDCLRGTDLRFDTRFGAGTDLPIGEDYIFVCDMLDAGLRGRAFPVVTGAHPDASTGGVWNDPVILRARRAVLARCFGKMAWIVRAAYALRHIRHLGGLGAAWGFYTGNTPKFQQKSD